uniref:ARAD1C09328p n=1 Tax=Blastobotrys adeninivorans TaxID=409370 RepID=A0A060T023_BLAAD
MPSSPRRSSTTFFITNTEPQSSSASPASSVRPPSICGSGPFNIPAHNSRTPFTKVTLASATSSTFDIAGEDRSEQSESDSLHDSTVDMTSLNESGHGSPGSHFSDDDPLSSPQISLDRYHWDRDEEDSDELDPLTSRRASPQLVMPRVALPACRQFTENGVKVGKLKILVAGDSGVGKTQLIRAIGQVCRDIVYIDDKEDMSFALAPWNGPGTNCSSSISNPPPPLWHHYVQEVYASTQPYPLFWDRTDSEEEDEGSFTSARRPSLVHSSSSARSNDTTLNRNVCFVDSVGYGDNSCDTDEHMDAIVSYLESMFRQSANSINVSTAHITKMFTSAKDVAEFGHVDVCLYMILNRVKNIDIEYMARISEYAPIIPVVAQSDLLGDRDIVQLKLNILRQMDRAGIRPFLFDTKLKDAISTAESRRRSSANGQGPSPDDEDSDKKGTYLDPLLFPCAVSSVESKDPEMVASVLMDPDYVPELHSSELKDLCSYLFSEHGAAWLRYTAAKKFIKWALSIRIASGLSTTLNNGPSATECNALVVQDHEDMVVNLPDSFFSSTGRGRAQQRIAQWAMSIENASRAEDAYALRAQGAMLRRRSRRHRNGSNVSSTVGNTAQPSSDGRVSIFHARSIFNFDPLHLKDLPEILFGYAVKILGIVIGAKAIMWTVSHSTVAEKVPAPPRPVTVKQTSWWDIMLGWF